MGKRLMLENRGKKILHVNGTLWKETQKCEIASKESDRYKIN